MHAPLTPLLSAHAADAAYLAHRTSLDSHALCSASFSPLAISPHTLPKKLTARLAHRSKKPRMQWPRLSSLQVGCSQESVFQCVIRLQGLEIVMQPARLAEHALDTSRQGCPAQVLPRHLGERREPLGAAGCEIYWQVVTARLPPREQVQVHIADSWQRQVLPT
jgi:hypothetical protein